ncbi:unnamed protein product [Musa textilis]
MEGLDFNRSERNHVSSSCFLLLSIRISSISRIRAFHSRSLSLAWRKSGCQIPFYGYPAIPDGHL